MPTTHQETLRKFWSAIVRLDAPREGPKLFRFTGCDIDSRPGMTMRRLLKLLHAHGERTFTREYA